MSQFQKMGVFLGNSPADPAVLAFAAHMARLGTREIHCIRIGGNGPGGEEGTFDLAKLEAQVRDALPEDIADQISCEVQAGSSLVDVYKVARDADLDLMIVGRRLPSSQLGIGARFTRIARKSPCCVMVVPEQCHPHFGRILVAVDCSPHSKLAMESAISLAKASGETHPQLLALTVRHVATQHHAVGVSFEESAENQRRHAQRDYNHFMTKIDTQGLLVESLITLSDEPADSISHVATVRKMDIVVIGSRGPTRPVAALLGSTSERVLMACPMPVLIVKEKGETLHLLEAIFSME